MASIQIRQPLRAPHLGPQRGPRAVGGEASAQPAAAGNARRTLPRVSASSTAGSGFTDENGRTGPGVVSVDTKCAEAHGIC